MAQNKIPVGDTRYSTHSQHAMMYTEEKRLVEHARNTGDVTGIAKFWAQKRKSFLEAAELAGRY